MFYIGQDVVAIRNHSEGIFKKGQEFIVESVSTCMCGRPVIELRGVVAAGVGTRCNFCMKVIKGSYFYAESFAPIILSSIKFAEELIKDLEIEINEENLILK